MPVPEQSSLSLQTQQQFQFESAASKLFHNKITHRDRGENDPYASSRAVLTTVQVNDKFTVNDFFTMEAVVSVTFSQVGIYKALKRSPLTGGLEEKVAPNLAYLLSNLVSEQELVSVLELSGVINEGGIEEDQLQVSFESFDGDFNERGMYSLGDTEIVSNGKNGGWAMFWAGIFFTLVFGSSIAVASWLYKAEHGHWPFFPDVDDAKDDVVMHNEENVMEDRIIPASGLLGLKGHHPSAASKENSHPNSAPRRRKRIGAKDSPSSFDTSAFTPSSQATSSSRNPLGIRSMRKLNTSFFTPQKSRSSSRQMVLYDVERLTKSDEKSVRSNVALFD